MDGNSELCRIYRQMDGYPEGHGVDLARLCDVEIVNGYSLNQKAGTHANGMGCLAAQIIAGLKTGIGGIYLETANGPIGDWVEYVYVIRGVEKHRPVIECSTHTGEWPFNMQTEEGHVFTGTAKAWLKQYARKRA